MVVDFDPVIFNIGPIAIRWYGLMYVVGFVLAGYLLKILVKQGFFKVEENKIDNLITTMLIGMFLGARIFYVFVYNWSDYAQSPLDIFAVWKGGLSFHGALIGLLVSGYVFSKRNNISWAQTMDCVALSGTPGLFFGRIGNFINGELYGRISDVPWAMTFKNGGPFSRHPSQLYEALMEGIILSLILWLIKKRVNSYGIIACCFVIGYGFFRFIVEFFREADPQLGYYFSNTLTMGQILCLLMILCGSLALIFVKKLNLKN